MFPNHDVFMLFFHNLFSASFFFFKVQSSKIGVRITHGRALHIGKYGASYSSRK